ncbi:Polyketide cyclase/dehydrase [Streptomyces albus]|uniref:Polyketide cyclase/dehydrase n=1 Tax=Streptomyces albus (strain ATCC 21838 / DSM 41398 / FERM P-419 / JCM 4703 / NBRC 107858) TaxID=1081613 RepID=A0A0B5F3I6_STRA4|nr:Polyketide cyclase/dehydrase [Streptomyces albus]AOU79750.1 Polyketide cyclase/dehydrase [Streptomyces albus]AYN35475.1 polyketide cyclase [Streptomyces albus]
MVHVERVITLDRPLARVVAYLSDFSHAVEWDPGTQECERSGSGPLTVGAEWDNTSVFRGRTTQLRYRLDRLEENRLTFTGENKTAHSTDDMTFTAEGEGTVLTYRATIRFKGLARLADPFLRREFERLGDEVSRTLPAAVYDALP